MLMKRALNMEEKIDQEGFDISDEACLALGFKAGTRIIDPDGDHGVVVGVAFNTNGLNCFDYSDDSDECNKCTTQPCLWYKIDNNNEVTHYGAGNMREVLRPESVDE